MTTGMSDNQPGCNPIRFLLTWLVIILLLGAVIRAAQWAF